MKSHAGFHEKWACLDLHTIASNSSGAKSVMLTSVCSVVVSDRDDVCLLHLRSSEGAKLLFMSRVNGIDLLHNCRAQCLLG